MSATTALREQFEHVQFEDLLPSYQSVVTPIEQQPGRPQTLRFDPGDYQIGDRVPRSLLTYDDWLPDPPALPVVWRRVDPAISAAGGNAVITYDEHDGSLGKMESLHLDIVQQRAPLIAAAFEPSERHHSLHLDALTPLSAQPFIRYIYQGTYAELNYGDDFEAVPTSLLLHCQMHFLGTLFEMPDLKSQALFNVIRQCEYACFSPHQPIDLCAALQYCYSHVKDSRPAVDNIIAYCIQRFNEHALGKDMAFCNLAQTEPRLYSDLAKALVERNFADDAALDIIRLPLPPLSDQSSVCDGKRSGPTHNLSEPPSLSATRPDNPASLHTPTPTTSNHRMSLITMALRQRQAESSQACPFVDEDFVLVNPTVEAHVPSTDADAEHASFVLVPQPDNSSPCTVVNTFSNSWDSVHTPSAIGGSALDSASPKSDSSWVVT